jgi:excisionase family DNA binding protein
MSLEEAPPPPMPGALFCSVLQAAHMVGRCERWVYDAVANGELHAVKSGRRTLISMASIHAYAAGLPAAIIKPMSRKST